ncbi:Uu.00g133070.m01.CDS01 [Anthostomella pinea]|uniref:Uu.00g133070.m01.CDS01 n=1 Tax=Anthostomella pinea TaxID=933095 RepID=A0AAI8VU53_9PEZI|nr:Uu.00g133070.m01.CDS01 [Anthostomella pinea]
MAIRLLSDNDSVPRTRCRVIASAAVATISLILLGLWALLQLNATPEFIAWSKELADFSSSYTPTEQLLIGSSGFSLSVSAVIEAWHFSLFGKGAAWTKHWLRKGFFLIVLVNATLAGSAFVLASIIGTLESQGALVIAPSMDLQLGIDQHSSASTTWSCEWHTIQSLHGAQVIGRSCKTRLASRWLCSCIVMFSLLLAVSGWLDFRQEDETEVMAWIADKKKRNEKETDSLV